MTYFAQFPKLQYDMKADGNVNVVPDIFRRIKLKDKIRDNLVILDKYDLTDGEKPEDVSFKIYGSVDYYWVVLLINGIVDRYYDWPMGFQEFEEYINDKYENPGEIHHYEVVQSSGRQKGDSPEDYSHTIEVNADHQNAVSVSNYEHEQRLQNKKRQIKILNPDYLSSFIEEFEKLIRR
tara:strand:- start:760 stop:1296 length:537 start_codon:yes stop_codon:yes gene_type:complete